MSEYKNVVGGRLKLKGKALDVKEGGVKKKKKKHQLEESSQIEHDELHKGLFLVIHWPILDLINTV
jgi:protein FAM32A